ncbi:hypothetical protein EXIGLDRAFT_767111 [Exidia glandulosa HHB12029]|uniref:Extracellular metalloproteinase n=1 Tax=Exidia glandulosa HHB12029 TaxID=1314781 RepID=A0A165J872_EXIGL|nr:hypothetical protein EXIGLDRAFT_767111 [Exidia glandulosa HHB12029]
MRRAVLSIVLALGLGVSCAPHRKSLSFAPRLRHAVFRTTPTTLHEDPKEVAGALVAHLHPDAEYRVRGDSYTDTLSGTSHVYLQQYVGGLEVLNGKMNVNVKDGVVLSYGDSFANDTTNIAEASAVDVHAQYCAHLRSHVEGLQQQPFRVQAPLLPHERSHGQLPSSADIFQHQCSPNRVALASTVSATLPVDARVAALSFMIHATTRDDTAAFLAMTFDAQIAHITILSAAQDKLNDWSYTLQNVHGTTEGVKAKLAYIQIPSDDAHGTLLHSVWKLEVHMENNTYEVAMSTDSPSKIISVLDRVLDSPLYAAPQGPEQRALDPHSHSHTYRVLAWGVNDPGSGQRTNVTIVPDRIASPLGWHTVPITHIPSVMDPRTADDWDTTIGNNIFAQEWWYKWERPWWTRYRPTSSTPWPALTFDYTYEPKGNRDKLNEAQTYVNASITQLWYTANMVHDLFYRYGFDEAAGNFQQYNFGRGGEENDAIILNAQDYSGWNGGNFEITPDGKSPVCKIFLWSRSGPDPYFDGALEADIVVHELTHGLSSRLVGGPADASCLQSGEAGGLGEGWSDFLTLLVRAGEKYEDLGMGVWASGKSAGIRSHAYSLNHTMNPTTFKYLDDPAFAGSIHRVGEVWANMLWGVLHRLISTHGPSPSLFPPEEPDETFYRYDNGTRPVPRHGNTLALQIVVDSMKLLPCNPTFLHARNATLQADEHLTGGENACDIWHGFADRGLGVDAHVIHGTPVDGSADVHVEDFRVPLKC